MSTATASPFNTKANSDEWGDYERPQPGTYPAILAALIDLGTHGFVYNGQAKESRKILLAWELAGEFDTKGNPFVIAQDFTWSLNKKAKLRGMVEGFIGRSLVDGEDYDLLTLLGQPCMVGVSEGITGSGKKFVEISSVSKPMKGLTVPPANHEPYAFAISMLTTAKDEIQIPAWVPMLYGRKVADDIQKSKEYGQLPPF